MNYRHAFHAGNFADVVKHAVLALIFTHLRRKTKPFRYIDTHAGIGLYDLDGPDAIRTGEWRGGIGLLDEAFEAPVEEVLRPYREALAAIRSRHGVATYPGSPAIAREFLTRADRAILVEKHPADADTLTRRYNQLAAVKVLSMDGWTALGALIPPPERRGLVLIDPPYEEPGELARAADALIRATRRWPTGILALWYPVKSVELADAMVASLSGSIARPGLAIELMVDHPTTTGPLAAAGLFVVNPPWTLEGDCLTVLPALAERLARRAGSGSYRCLPV